MRKIVYCCDECKQACESGLSATVVDHGDDVFIELGRWLYPAEMHFCGVPCLARWVAAGGLMKGLDDAKETR